MADPITDDNFLDLNTDATSASSLSFPKNYATEAGQFIAFQRYTFSKASITTPGTAAKAANSSMVVLPIPPQLLSNYAVDWSNISLGMAKSQFQQGVDTVKNTLMQGNGSIADALSLGQQAVSAAPMYLLKGFLDAAADSKTGSAIANELGIAANPYQAAIFQGANFRQFQFSWKLFPSNKSESETVYSIIKEFKVGMAPSFLGTAGGIDFQDNIYKYPDMWQIQFADDSHLFKIHFCVLLNVSVDYHGENTPLYFRGDAKRPASIIINTVFQEVKIMTKEDFEQGF